MKKNFKKTIILLSVVTLFIGFSSNVSAWDDCPFGYEDEEYPGTCWRYIDTNNDGICDHSQEESSLESDSEEIKANIESTQNQDSTRFPILLVLSLIITLTLILILKTLVKKKKLSNTKEKIILNLLLLIFFIPSAITGIVLLLMTNMRILIDLGPSFTQLHNISSLFFMWISAYHIIWHTKYYMKSMKKLLKYRT